MFRQAKLNLTEILSVDFAILLHTLYVFLTLCIFFIFLSLLISPSPQVDDSVEALDAAAVEAALSLCEEAVSEGHTLNGPWETQELKASDQAAAVQESVHMQEPQDMAPAATVIPAATEPQNHPETKKGESQKGNCERSEITGTEIAASVASDDGAAGIEVPEEGTAGKETTEATLKSEGEEWNQPEPNPPCLGWCPWGKRPPILMKLCLLSFRKYTS